jgi:hypothetical protein
VIEGQFETRYVRKPYDFLMVTLALLFKPFTTPLEIKLLSPEVVKDQLTMLVEGAGDLLHRLDARTHGLAAP